MDRPSNPEKRWRYWLFSIRNNPDYADRASGNLESYITDLEEALRRISGVQPRVLAMLRREGFVFETPLNKSEGWEKLAFTLYTTICEVDQIARIVEEDG